MSSSSPREIEPVLRGAITKGSVRRDGADFIVEAEMVGPSAKELNRSLLSALRRVEKRTRLRSEWTADGATERYFDYVLKKVIKG
ncbi:MAG: hypothetical protein JRN24_02300 [Nitrososphaerota archaeon]|nr:hypothetical protein [Nitrososphaerota archaeon]